MRLPDPRPVESVVTVPSAEAASDKRIRWAYDRARVEMSELAREQDHELTLDGVEIELVESGFHTWLGPKHWSFYFRATPVWQPGAKRRKARARR